MTKFFLLRIKTIFVWGFICLITSCGSNTRNEVDGKRGSFSGSISFQDKPVTGGQIFLISQGKNPVQIINAIKPDGTFNIPDVPIGNYKILIDTGEVLDTAKSITKDGNDNSKIKSIGKVVNKSLDNQEKLMAKMFPKGRLGSPIALPQEYSNPEKTPLKIEIKEGVNQQEINLNKELIDRN